MIFLLLFLAGVMLVFFVFPDWPLLAVLLTPLGTLALAWLAKLVLRRSKSAGAKKRSTEIVP
jgi:predicted MFS family arabinose efflux permease